MSVVLPNHPKQKLLFFVVSDLDDTIRADMKTLVGSLAASRDWVIGPPLFVDTREEPQDTSGDDVAIETVGGYLEIHTAWPPWKLPREIDLQHLDEVEQLVGALGDLSRLRKLEIEFELAGTFVGAIEEGEMDRSLSVGLLGEWRRHLGNGDDLSRSPG
jgi:hypothetical protein